MLIKLPLVLAMTDLYDSEDVQANHKRSLRRLAKAISLSQGEFSLILVSCNYPQLQEQMAKLLKEISTVEIQELVLHPSVKTLYTTIQKTIEDRQPQALMVFGLDSVVDINQVLTSTNLVRNQFRKQFAFPLVLWVSDEILQKLTRMAPDFKNWATTAIRFEVPNNQSIEWTAITAWKRSILQDD